MKKYLIITMIMISIISPIMANTFGVVTTNYGKIYYGWIADGSEEEFRESAIAQICDLYLMENYKSKYKSLPEIHLSTSFSSEENYAIHYKQNKIFITISSNKNLAEKSLKAIDVMLDNLTFFKEAYKFNKKQGSENREIEINESIIISAMHQELNETQKIFLNTEFFRIKYDKQPRRKYNKNDVIYSFKNDTFCFFENDDRVKNLSRIRFALSDYNYGSLIFDTDSTFYFINAKNGQGFGKKHIIKLKDFSTSFTKEYVDGVTLNFYFYYTQYVNHNGLSNVRTRRYFVYNIEKDILIEDLQIDINELINNKINNR